MEMAKVERKTGRLNIKPKGIDRLLPEKSILKVNVFFRNIDMVFSYPESQPVASLNSR